jgi:cell division control protein 6
MTDNLIQNPEPLQSDYLPPEFVGRDREQSGLTKAFSDIADGSLGNLHISGPPGTGKTHLTHSILEKLPDKANISYISCRQHDTQYKALKQLYSPVSGKDVESGYHTSALQRRIEKQTTHLPTVIALDDIEFLLLNDGNDLLYYLSRLGENISTVTITSDQTDLQSKLEERTYSSLQPQRIVFKPYEAKQVYRILANRARTALRPQSLHRDVLTYISSRTRNVTLSLHWLRAATEKAADPITVDTVKQVQSTARRRYVDNLFNNFTPHHELLFQAIVELTTENNHETCLRTGSVYNRYKDLCGTYNEEVVG